jgi:hypothetical protein
MQGLSFGGAVLFPLLGFEYLPSQSVPEYIYIYPLSRDMPAPDMVNFGNIQRDHLIVNHFNSIK